MPPAGRWLLSPGCPGIPPSNGDRPECASQSSISSQPRPVTHVNRVSRAEGRTDSLYHPYYNVKRLKTLVSRPVRALARPWRPHPPTWIIHQPFVWLLAAIWRRLPILLIDDVILYVLRIKIVIFTIMMLAL
jgi:hypothetical protein